MNANIRNFAVWVVVVLLLLALFTLFQNPGQQRPSSQEITYSQLLNEVDRGRVRSVSIRGTEVQGTYTDGRLFNANIPTPNDPNVMTRLHDKGVPITIPQASDEAWFLSLLTSWLPFIVLIGVWFFLSQRMRGTTTGMNFGQQSEIESLKRQVADLQRQIDQLKNGPR